MYCLIVLCLFLKQKTAYEMRISDWSSDVCSSDLAIISRSGIEHRLVAREVRLRRQDVHRLRAGDARHEFHRQRLDPRLGISVDPRPLTKRVEPRDQPREIGRAHV